MAHEFSPLSPTLWVGGVPPHLLSCASIEKVFRKLANDAAGSVANVTVMPPPPAAPRYAFVRMSTATLALAVKAPPGSAGAAE